MAKVRHVNLFFGDEDKLRTKHQYTKEQARELQEIAVKAADVALRTGGRFVPRPVTEPSDE